MKDNDLPTFIQAGGPANYTSKEAKARFAWSKRLSMGSDPPWTMEEIAEALDHSVRHTYRIMYDSDVGKQVHKALGAVEDEWVMDQALTMRREVERLEEIEQELLKRKKAVATDFETKTVRGTPTGDRNIRLPEHADEYKLKMPVPTDFEVVTDYGRDLESVQKEKRQYLAQLAKLLGLNAADKKEIDHKLASRHEEVKIVEYREADDDYPEAEPQLDGQYDPDSAGPVEVEAVEDVDDG